MSKNFHYTVLTFMAPGPVACIVHTCTCHCLVAMLSRFWCVDYKKKKKKKKTLSQKKKRIEKEKEKLRTNWNGYTWKKSTEVALHYIP